MTAQKLVDHDDDQGYPLIFLAFEDIAAAMGRDEIRVLDAENVCAAYGEEFLVWEDILSCD